MTDEPTNGAPVPMPPPIQPQAPRIQAQVYLHHVLQVIMPVLAGCDVVISVRSLGSNEVTSYASGTAQTAAETLKRSLKDYVALGIKQDKEAKKARKQGAPPAMPGPSTKQ